MPDLAEELRAELSRARGAFALGAPALTAAELRLLPMLSTHLSFPEIAGEMFLSPHTVKSQAASIYRKLGACSRSQAVSRLRDLGLLGRSRADSSSSPGWEEPARAARGRDRNGLGSEARARWHGAEPDSAGKHGTVRERYAG